MKNLKLKLSLALAAGLLALAGYLIAASSFLPTPAASSQPIGYVAQLGITDFNVSKGTSIAFRGYYDRQYWSGDVFAYQVDKDGNITTNELWEGAGFHVQSQNYDTGRMIGTMKDDGTAIPFRLSSLSTAQQNSLNGTTTTAQNILDYVRGKRGDEISSGGSFRDRALLNVLGDIIHSRPAYVANGANPVLFVGANDGMLHALDGRGAGGGAELWAYVPSMLIGNLSKLTAEPYDHTYFVDGGLNVATAAIGGASKKVLVSGLGAGGKGLFALDVTTPTATSEADVASKRLWEITPTSINGTASASYANLGYTYGVPLIVQLNTTGHPWAAIVGNGYNNSGNGHSILYVINIADGTLIKAIDTGSGTAGTSPGGLSSPAAIDTNADGYVDIVYAGDIDGKLWKFDLSSSDSTAWSTSLLFNTSNTPVTAITMAPAVATHTAGGYMVTFGTGRAFTSGSGSTYDIDTSGSTLQQNYAYGIWDGAPAANAVLLTQTLTEAKYDNASTSSATSTITITDPAGDASSVSGVLFDGVSILSSTQSFAAGQTADQIAATLSAALSNPTGYAHTVSGPTITFTATSSGGVGKTIFVTTPAAAPLTVTTTANPVTTPIRVITNNTPTWTSGASNHKGWKVQLPAGERLLGDTVFIENGRFYFNSTNPTKQYPADAGVPDGDNWLMELNYMNGGSSDTPFLDLNGDRLLNNGDRLTYVLGDALPVGKAIGDIVVNASSVISYNSLPVGKFISHGVSSHPLLVQLTTLNTTLMNQNPDVTIPAPSVQLGIIGGHFDEEVFFRDDRTAICDGATPSGGAAPIATLTLGSNGDTNPATLGGISVAGVTIVPPLSNTDLLNGTSSTTNATVITTKINNLTSTTGFSAARVNNVVTVSAPVGSFFNGATFVVTPGATAPYVPAVAAVTAVKASRSFTFTNAANVSPTGFSIKVNGTEILTSTASGSQSSTNLATWVRNNSSSPNYDITRSGSTVTVTAKSAATSTYDISSITISSTNTVSASSYSTVGAATAGVTAVTGVAAIAAAGSFTFNFSGNVSPTGFSIKVNGTEILTSTAPGSKSSSTLATWVAANYSSVNYNVTASGSTVTVTAKTAATTTYDISSIAIAENAADVSTYTSVGAATAGVTAVTGVTGVKAAKSVTFTNASNVNPAGFSVKVNGTEILTSSTPGSQSSTSLATWVKNNSSSANYDITNSGSTVTVTAKTAATTTYDISTLVVAENAANANTYTTVNAAVAGTGAVGTRPSNGSIVLTAVTSQSTATSVRCGATTLVSYTSNTGNGSSRRTQLYNAMNGLTVAGYSMSCNGTSSPMTCTITPPVGASACSAGFTTANLSVTTNTGPVGGTNASGTAASRTFDFTNGTNVSPSAFSISINGGANILTSTTPGPQSSSGLAAWVAANSSSANYNITASGNRVTVTAKQTSSAYNINTLTVSSSATASATHTTSATTAGVTAVTAVTGVAAARSFTFNNVPNINPTGFSVKVNGSEILTSTAPGSQSSSGLATWVTTHYSSANYNVTASGSTVTVTAKTATTGTYDISSIAVTSSALPASVTYTTSAFTAGRTPVTAVTAVAATRTITFSNTSNVNPTNLSIVVNGTEILTSSAPGPQSSSGLATWVAANSSLANYTITNPSSGVVRITATTAVASTYDITSIVVTGTESVATSTLGAATAGVTGVAAIAATGGTNLSPAITSSGTFSGGVEGTYSTARCTYDSHTHQYDKLFDRTGVNMLNASVSKLNMSNALPSSDTQFKVLVQNQYLSPAVKLNIANSTYQWNVDAGYIKLKDYATSQALTSDRFTALPVYTPATVGSLVINMPVDAFTPKNWWGDGTPGRAGLQPVHPYCVWDSGSSNRFTSTNQYGNGNMFQPVNPPANGTNGPGTKGWSDVTTSATTTGVRHGGALVIQVISARTPYSAIEESVPGRPEYGWRVKSALYENYVLVEWASFWHHPTNGCYFAAGWVNNPSQDDGSSNPTTGAAGATDPKIGSFGASQGEVTEVIVTTVKVDASGQTTTTVTTMNAGGGTPTTTTTTTVTAGSGPATPSNTSTKRINYLNGSWTEIVTTTNSDNTLTINITNSDGTTSSEIVPNNAGTIVSGGDEKGTQSRTGRISWSELYR